MPEDKKVQNDSGQYQVANLRPEEAGAGIARLPRSSMAALGVLNYQKLPIDAVPDITNVQVQINTQAPGYSPLET